MSLFKDIFNNSNRFIQGLSKEDQQQLAEIERLENEIKQFQEDQKKQKKAEFRITNRDMLKFWFFAMVMTFL
jgi:predicted ribosome quality control (RQC) complex YloA/Tae2 family protein